MTVLVCIPCLLTGGTEIQTLSLVEALVVAGHKPVVTCYFEFVPDMVKRYEDAGAIVELISRDGSRPNGIKATILHLYHGLRGTIERHKPKIAHVQYMAPGAIPIIILRLLGIRKIIATTHTMADIYPAHRQIHWLNRHILSAFQCITLTAEKSFFGTSKLFDSSFKLHKHDNHFTIYNNLPSYIEIAEKHRENHPKTIGVVSRLEYIKGMDLVVPAFAEVLKLQPEMNLLVVGDGSQRHLMEQQIKDLSIPSDRVEFAGRQTQDKLQNLYDRIGILLMPSRSEGFGLTAIEGMARGCVPVVANVGGLPEVVNDECGCIHDAEDVNDIAVKIQCAISMFDSKSSASIKRAGQFSMQNYFNQIKNLYSLIQ